MTRVAFLTTIFPMKEVFLLDFFDSLCRQTHVAFHVELGAGLGLDVFDHLAALPDDPALRAAARKLDADGLRLRTLATPHHTRHRTCHGLVVPTVLLRHGRAVP